MTHRFSTSVIGVGCYVDWKCDGVFRANHEPQMSRFFNAYGYGPFYVKEMDGDSVIINTAQGEKKVNTYYLQLVLLDPTEIATD